MNISLLRSFGNTYCF